MHTQPQFAASWCADFNLVDLQNLGATGLMKSNHTRHETYFYLPTFPHWTVHQLIYEDKMTSLGHGRS